MYKMQSLEVSGAVRPLQWSLGVKGLINWCNYAHGISHNKLTNEHIYYEHHLQGVRQIQSVTLPEEGPLRAEPCRSDTLLINWC